MGRSPGRKRQSPWRPGSTQQRLSSEFPFSWVEREQFFVTPPEYAGLTAAVLRAGHSGLTGPRAPCDHTCPGCRTRHITPHTSGHSTHHDAAHRPHLGSSDPHLPLGAGRLCGGAGHHRQTGRQRNAVAPAPGPCGVGAAAVSHRLGPGRWTLVALCGLPVFAGAAAALPARHTPPAGRRWPQSVGRAVGVLLAGSAAGAGRDRPVQRRRDRLCRAAVSTGIERGGRADDELPRGHRPVSGAGTGGAASAWPPVFFGGGSGGGGRLRGPMLDGDKRLASAVAPSRDDLGSRVAALLLLALCAGLSWWLSSLASAAGWGANSLHCGLSSVEPASWPRLPSPCAPRPRPPRWKRCARFFASTPTASVWTCASRTSRASWRNCPATMQRRAVHCCWPKSRAPLPAAARCARWTAPITQRRAK